MKTLVTIQDNKMLTTSKLVATAFGKQHKNVIQDIKNLNCSEQFGMLNFQHTPYTHPQNKQTYDLYNITRDGFTFLAMGYTGKRAAEFKEAYINQFNEMEAKIKSVQFDERFALLEGKIESLEGKLLAAPTSLKEAAPMFYNISTYLKMVEKQFESGQSSVIAKYAIKWHDNHKISIKRTKYGNHYLPRALDYAIASYEAKIIKLKQADINYLKTNKTAQDLKLLEVGEYMVFHLSNMSGNEPINVVRLINKWTDLYFKYEIRPKTMNPSVKITRHK